MSIIAKSGAINLLQPPAVSSAKQATPANENNQFISEHQLGVFTDFFGASYLLSETNEMNESSTMRTHVRFLPEIGGGRSRQAEKINYDCER